jgi:hypothetical protein
LLIVFDVVVVVVAVVVTSISKENCHFNSLPNGLERNNY